jgi:hypothetical protein
MRLVSLLDWRENKACDLLPAELKVLLITRANPIEQKKSPLRGRNSGRGIIRSSVTGANQHPNLRKLLLTRYDTSQFLEQQLAYQAMR